MQLSDLIDEPHPDLDATSSVSLELDVVQFPEPPSSLTKLSLNERAPSDDVLARRGRRGNVEIDHGSSGRDGSLDSHALATHTFIWEQPAKEVFVTGSFDGWINFVRLDKREGTFQKDVKLPRTHTLFKFVVDGRWTVNQAARTEKDANGTVNNVLLPHDFDNGRWATVKAEAAKHAAQKQTGNQDQYHEDHVSSTGGGDESIESCVSRIKARVAELTSDNIGQTYSVGSTSPTAYEAADKESHDILTPDQNPRDLGDAAVSAPKKDETTPTSNVPIMADNSQTALQDFANYTFRWRHAGVEVYVTGAFDNWKKSVKLEKRKGIFEKVVKLPKKTHIVQVRCRWHMDSRSRETYEI